MATISGISGAVNGVAAVGVWSVQTTKELGEIVDSSTAKGTQRIAGPQDWSGSFTSHAVAGATSFLPGTSFTFTGSLDGTNGVTGTAIVSQCVIRIPIGGTDPVSFEVSFVANGFLTRGAAAATDVTLADAINGVGTTVTLDDGETSEAVLTHVSMIEITLTREIGEYTDSSTYDETDGQYKGRLAGKYDFSIAITQNIDTFDDFPVEGAVQTVTIAVPGQSSTALSWVIWGELSGVTVDRASADPISGTINGSMSSQSGGVRGAVSVFGTSWWPSA